MTTPNSLITTRFNATSTAEDVVAGLDLTSIRAIVTGVSSGIGLETARACQCWRGSHPRSPQYRHWREGRI